MNFYNSRSACIIIYKTIIVWRIKRSSFCCWNLIWINITQNTNKFSKQVMYCLLRFVICFVVAQIYLTDLFIMIGYAHFAPIQIEYLVFHIPFYTKVYV